MTEQKTYLTFRARVFNGLCQYDIVNDKQDKLGRIEKVRLGQWMSWCLFLNEGCYMSASCLDEVREKIRSLNSNKLEVKE
jgi:hypothetical protein